MDTKVEERRQLVYDLHVQGWEFKEIARQIDTKYRDSLGKKYTSQDARRDFDLQSGLNHDIIDLHPNEQRQVMVQRLQQLFGAIWPKAAEGDFRAITTALKIMERQAELLGLDAPRKMLNMDLNIREEAEKFAKEHGLSEEDTRALISEAENIVKRSQANAKSARK